MGKTRTNRIFVFALVFATALLLVTAVIAVGLLIQSAEIKKERAELIRQIEILNSDRDKYWGELEYMNTLEWTEKKARALGLITSDQEIWILIDDGK